MLRRLALLFVGITIVALHRDSHAQVPLSFTTISNGTFTMGSPVGEVGRNAFIENQHSVTISTNFEMSVTEITQHQWFSVMGTNPSSFATVADCPASHTTISGVQMCPNFPVERVSWLNTQAFIATMNATAGLTCAGLPSDPSGCVRLPTEAEWEYATRAGTTIAWSWGSTTVPGPSHAWYGVNSGNQPQDVATKMANPSGLHDVHGNVWEWVNDWYIAAPAGGTDPTGPATGGFKVNRGGAYNTGSNCIQLRSAVRQPLGANGTYSQVGFRLARNL
jgi:formylglycine-generating enzyme required for sulfatase activity